MPMIIMAGLGFRLILWPINFLDILHWEIGQTLLCFKWILGVEMEITVCTKFIVSSYLLDGRKVGVLDMKSIYIL